MKRKSVLFVLFIIMVSAVLVSCTSSVGMEEFTSYKVERDSEIQSLVQEIERSNVEFVSLKASIAEVKEENGMLIKEIATINEDLNRTYSEINNLVVLAGYETGEDFINLARDIVYVNNNIKKLNDKIEILRSAMASFVNN